MMSAWLFSCRTEDEVAALLRALEKHRYIREVDHRIHWLVDAALHDQPSFHEQAAAFLRLRQSDPTLDPASRDPRLWRSASLTEIIAVFRSFWTSSAESIAARQRLHTLFHKLTLPPPTHEPFAGDVEFPHHPELLQLSWTLYPVVDLDADRHAGALRAMEEAHEEVDVSAPVDQEGPELGVQELTQGAPRGVLVGEFLLWADGPYAYNDYIFRGASKAAKLLDPPEGALENNEEDSGGYVDT